MFRKYHVTLHSQMGPKKGTLMLKEDRGAITGMTAACAAQACGTVEGAPGYFFKSAYEHEKQAEVSKNHGEIFWRLLVCGELLLRTRRFLPKSS